MVFAFVSVKYLCKLQARQFRVTDQVFLDIKSEERSLGRVVIGLFGDLAPRAVRNFKVLATSGVKGKSYKGTRFNRIIKRFMVQGITEYAPIIDQNTTLKSYQS